MIDREWLAASDGKFGLSVQLAIYKQTGNRIGNWDEEGNWTWDEAAYRRFGDAVGWRANGSWKDYSELTWSTNAPSTAPGGHLPVGGFGLVGEIKRGRWIERSGGGRFRPAAVSALRLVNCSI